MLHHQLALRALFIVIIAPVYAQSPTASAPAGSLSSGQGWLIAAIGVVATIAGARINSKTQKSLQKSTSQTQEGLQRLTAQLRRKESQEAQHAEPFLTALLQSLHLASDVSSYVNSLRACPLSPEFRREFLNSVGIVNKWGQTGVELCERRAGMLLVLGGPQINLFVVEFKKLIEKQFAIIEELQFSFDFSEGHYGGLESKLVDHSKATASVFSLLRNSVLHGDHEDSKTPVEFSIEGLAASLRFKATPLSFEFINPIATWTVWWRWEPHRTIDAASESTTKLAELRAALGNFKGTLRLREEEASSVNSDATRIVKHVVITAEFVSSAYREKFLEILPEIEMQSRCLWDGTCTEMTGFKYSPLRSGA